MFDNSDEYNFTPSKSSKLASLFGINSVPKEATSDSLIYKPPKQPSQDPNSQVDTSNNSKTKSNTTVIIAKVVNLWKLKAKRYELLGTYGLALIGSADLNLYEIIGYKEKNDIIFRNKVNSNFVFYNQKENFSTFCDNESQQWLVKFENSDQIEFSKKIEYHGANVNSNIEDSEQKTSIDYEISNPKPDISPKPQQNVEIHLDSSRSQKRTSILNRMAKMGQPILPIFPAKNTSSELSDSEVEENKDDKRIPPRKFKRSYLEKAPKDEILTPVIDNRQILPVQNNPTTNSFNIPAPIIYGQPLGYDSFNNFILTQNTELKMNLTQITAKLDRVLNEGNTVPSKSNNNHLTAKVKTLQLKSDNLQNALQKSENRYSHLKEKYDSLLKQTEDKTKIEFQESKIKKLEEEVAHLKINLEECNGILKNKEIIEAELEKCKIQIREYEKTIENQTQKLKDLEHKQNNTEELETTIKSLNAKIENFKLKQKDFQEYLRTSSIERKDQTKRTNAHLNTYSEIVKQHMNDMYQSILDDFDDDIACSYSYTDIQSFVAKQLKGTTFKLIEDCKNIFFKV